MRPPKITLTADGKRGVSLNYVEARLLPEFEGVRLKIQRAKRHFGELERLLVAYRVAARHRWNQHWEPHYEHMQAWWIVWGPPAPPELPTIVGDIAHNLRASLDVMICDLARKQGRGVSDLKFPFGEDASGWRTALGSPALKRIGPDALKAVSALGAYRNGPSSGLRALHDLDVLDKHRLVVPIFAGFWAAVPPEIKDMIPPERIKGSLHVISEEDTFLIRKDWGLTALPKPTSGAIALFPYGLSQIAALAGRPVLETFNDAINNVEEVTETFAAHFG